MRLLDARNLELVDVRDDDVPPYAILSHTWQDDEVTLQDMRRMRGTMPQEQQIANKKGFVKIQRAAAMAVQRGFNHIWIDTCCIDKTSSSELSEAINSMYYWYLRAAECYAILSDVEPVGDNNLWLHQRSQLRSSRWFTRGWTLQELIAPANVLFFANDWSLLGRKDNPQDFADIISEVTGIEPEVLDGRLEPTQLSIATRMKWAANRQTTRLEDSAYCLMGLFQVNMPLLYGEGQRAFARLQEEIIQRSDDQSLFAWDAINNIPSASDDAVDQDELCGLLATCPALFRDVGELQPLPLLPVHSSAPSTMTNQGLRLQLRLRPMHEHEGVPMEEDFYAILDCIVRFGDQYLCPAIPLRRLSEDQYARLKSKPLKFLTTPESDIQLETEGYRTIYVRQSPTYYHLPQIRVSSLHSVPSSRDRDVAKIRDWVTAPYATFEPNGPAPHYKLVDAFPSSQWNSHTLTMAAKYSRALQAMALFRFRDQRSPENSDGSSIDVVVGLRRLDAMRWEGWCFQLSCQGTPAPLASVMETVNQKIRALLDVDKEGTVSTTALRDALGDDRNLVTDATVRGVQLQGRWYVSVGVSIKLEMSLEGVLATAQKHHPNDDSRPDSDDDDSEFGAQLGGMENTARILTGRPWMVALTATPLHQAVDSFPRDIQALEMLVRHPTYYSVNDTDSLGRSPLWWAAAQGKIPALDILISSGALVNLADDMGLTPLHIAARGGHLAAVTWLLKKGARRAVWTHELDLTPMDLAAMFGDIGVLTELVLNTHGFLSQELLNRALHITASCGHLSCVNFLLSVNADPTVSYEYLFKLDDETEAHASVLHLAGDAIFAATQTGKKKVVERVQHWIQGRRHASGPLDSGFDDWGLQESSLGLVPSMQQPPSSTIPSSVPQNASIIGPKPPASSLPFSRYSSTNSGWNPSVDRYTSSSSAGSHSTTFPAIATSRGGSQASAKPSSAPPWLGNQRPPGGVSSHPPTRVPTMNGNVSLEIAYRGNKSNSAAFIVAPHIYELDDTGYPPRPTVYQLEAPPYQPRSRVDLPLRFLMDDDGARKYRRYRKGGFEYADAPPSPAERNDSAG